MSSDAASAERTDGSGGNGFSFSDKRKRVHRGLGCVDGIGERKVAMVIGFGRPT